MNVVPRRSSLWTAIRPPLWCTIPNTVESPSPVPLPSSLVVKKGSKICALVSASMPEPVSETIRRTVSARASVAIVSRPPVSIASRALIARFITTCSSWQRSATSGQGASSSSKRSSNCAPIRRASSGPHLPHDLVEVQRPRAQRLAAAEREQALRELGRALARALGLVDVAADRVVLVQPQQRELAEPDHGGHEVVEVVRDAARQPADGLELLGLQQRALELLAGA